MRNDQASVMEHLATSGPLAIALDASVFHMYQVCPLTLTDYNLKTFNFLCYTKVGTLYHNLG